MLRARSVARTTGSLSKTKQRNTSSIDSTCASETCSCFGGSEDSTITDKSSLRSSAKSFQKLKLSESGYNDYRTHEVAENGAGISTFCFNFERTDRKSDTERNVKKWQFSKNNGTGLIRDTRNGDAPTTGAGRCSSLNNEILPRSYSKKAKKFGDFQETYDWIECESKRMPGRKYYYNLRSLSRTWIRPVSRNVRLSFFRPRSNNCDSSTSDLEDSLMVISSEDEDQNSEESLSSFMLRNCDRVTRNKRSKILCRLYNEKLEEKNDRGESTEDRKSQKSEAFRKQPTIPEYTNLMFDPIDFVETQIPSEDIASDIPTKLNTDSESDDGISLSKSIKRCASDTASYTSDKGEFVRFYSVPWLREIKISDLSRYSLKIKSKTVKKIISKPKVVKAPKKKQTRPKTTKIISEMYGTRTINYEPTIVEVPPGTIVERLSDSNVSFWSTFSKNNIQRNIENEDADIISKIPRLLLSESSSTCSSSTSSSSYSSCSTCSSTSSSNSSSTGSSPCTGSSSSTDSSSSGGTSVITN